MWSTVLAMLGFLALIVLIVTLFTVDILIVTINVAILYFIWLKAYADVVKKKRWKEYAYSLIGGLLLTFVFSKYVPLWWVTQAAGYTLVLTLVWHHFLKNFLRK